MATAAHCSHDYLTAADVSEEVAIRPESSLPPFTYIDTSSNNNQWELQHLRREQQDPLLAESFPKMTNKRFSLLDVGRETVHLARVRSTFFSVFLATFTLVLLLQHVLTDYISYTQRHGVGLKIVSERKLSCEKNILYPWREAVLTRNLTSAKQEEFYTLFKQNCSGIIKDPPEETGFFSFKNGTFTLSNPIGFPYAEGVLSPSHVGGFFLLQAVSWFWSCWGEAATAWGLLVATTTTMSYYSRPWHRNPIQMPSQKITDAFEEQFSYKVFLGFIRVCLTDMLTWVFVLAMTYFIAMVRSIVVNNSIDFKTIMELVATPNIFWALADPVPYIFLLSKVAAAVEPGVWGFKALWRGVQLARGNRLKSYFIYLALFLLVWLDFYLSSLLVLEPDQATDESLLGMIRRSIMRSIFTLMALLPSLFLVPIFYFLCKAWREKVATMA